MFAEEKMAVRVLARAELEPPFDLLALTEQYAKVEYMPFPSTVDADGVTIGLGDIGKPHILINSSKPRTRQKFTLAHELGHVIIPWHTGIIASHIKEGGGDDYEYWNMEAEANRFASELLIPTKWVREEFKAGASFAKIFAKTLSAVGTSRDAFLIKVFNALDQPVLCVQVAESGKILKRYRSGGMPRYDNLPTVEMLDVYFAENLDCREEFSSGDRDFVIWKPSPIAVIEYDQRSWREVLEQIIQETGVRSAIPSINAILPAQLSSCTNLSVEATCEKVMLAYQGREKIASVVSHPLFLQYVIKRVRELKSRSR